MGNSNSNAKTSQNDTTMAEVKDFIQKEVDSHKVVIWSKSYCPYCKATKDLFKDKLSEVTDVVVHELDRRGDGSKIQAELTTMTGQRTVPNVFVGGKQIGGNDDTQAAFQNGTLKQMLQ